MARDWAGLCPYSKVSKVTVGLESYGAEPRVVRTKHRMLPREQPIAHPPDTQVRVHFGVHTSIRRRVTPAISP